MLQRVLFFALLMSFKVSAHGFHFPDARFVGDGFWENNFGQHESYDVYLEFFGDEMRSEYHSFEGDFRISIAFLFYNAFGDFDVAYNGFISGQGSCFANRCSYFYFDEAGIRNDETITFSESVINRVGFKTIDGVLIRWDEVLERVVPHVEPIIIPVIEEPVFVPAT